VTAGAIVNNMPTLYQLDRTFLGRVRDRDSCRFIRAFSRSSRSFSFCCRSRSLSDKIRSSSFNVTHPSREFRTLEINLISTANRHEDMRTHQIEFGNETISSEGHDLCQSSARGLVSSSSWRLSELFLDRNITDRRELKDAKTVTSPSRRSW
jgi:hypothetical protein